MRMTPILVSVLFSLVAASVCGQVQPIRSLDDLLASGDLTLTNVRGRSATGGSTGTVLEGILENRTGETVRVRSQLGQGLFVESQTSGVQDMLATGVYGGDGGYFVEGGESFIRVAPHGEKDVLFNAYCVDFEKDNPNSRHAFAVRPVPLALLNILDNILAYEQVGGGGGQSDPVPAQVALWMAQGVEPSEISERFAFTSSQLREAHRILGR